MGFFDKLKQSLEKTKIALGIKKVDENLLEELEEKLIMSDVGMTATDEIMRELKTRIKQDKIVDSQKVIEILKEQLEKILTKEDNKLNLETSPAAILMVGVNGAGKTTIFNLLTGVYKPTDGDISINQISINKKTTPQIVALGVARTFQNIRLFKELSVLDNVKLAFNNSMNYNTFEAIFRLPRFWKEEKEVTDKALDLLDIFDMAEMANITAGNLSYGQQRKLEIARALATNPKLLLLDEPAAGMNPNETKELMNTISFIRNKFKIAILLIEHDMDLVMGICERLYVLNFGRIIASGLPDEIQNNKEVITAYLGE